jgi:hypothetical protein
MENAMNDDDQNAANATRGDASRPESVLQSLVGLATSAVERYASKRKDHFADIIIDLAATVRRSGRRFEGDQDWLADAIDKGAGIVRDAAEDFRQADIRDLAAQGRSIARERPTLFAAGAILLGVVAAAYARRALTDLRSATARPA